MSFLGTRSEQSSPMTLTRAASSSRAVFFTVAALVYTVAIVFATLAFNPYFSQTWDVQTFIQAAHRFLDGGNPFDLYAASRVAQTWPYAYPPLHAFVVAIALFIGNLLPILPDYIWARVPTILADIGVALVLYDIVRRKANDETMARAAALLWLFNPVTFYDTAVQGHFESEWLLFVLLAYAWFETSRNIILPTIALAVAVLFKQTAIVFAIPMYVGWLGSWLVGWLDSRGNKLNNQPTNQPTNCPTVQLSNLFLSIILFVFIIGIICLPYLLYSNDFLYMNLTYVENVPVQTQSWLIAVLGLTRDAPTAMTSDFFLFRYQTIVTLLAAGVIALFGARRGWSVYLTATLIAIAFFLTSKKVMGYYYVMLFPFLLAELLPKRRFGLAAIATSVVTFISLSPYYASWTNHAHWWVYAVLGMVNSIFFVWLGLRLTKDGGRKTDDPSTASSTRSARSESAQDDEVGRLRSAVMIAIGLFAGAVSAAILQPFISNNSSPIRAPIVAAGMESTASVVFAGLIGLILVVLFIANRLIKIDGARMSRAVFGIVIVFAPLFFSIYTLTKESTAIFEIALKALGV